MTKNKTAAKKTEDQSVVYKVPAAFALMVLVVYGFWKLGSYYATMSGFSAPIRSERKMPSMSRSRPERRSFAVWAWTVPLETT